MRTTFKKTLLAGTLALVGGFVLWLSTSYAVDDNKIDKAPPAKANVVVDKAAVRQEIKLATSFAPVVKKVSPTVVNIYTTKTVKGRAMEMMPFLDDPFFRRFFGDQFRNRNPRQAPPSFKERSLGSGVVVTADGYILTNDHVVDGADEIKVTFEKDKREFSAKIIGKDPKTDIAVLKIDAKDLPFATLGDSDTLEVGDRVLAIGNPFGIGQTVTVGIVSALSRGGMGIEDYEDFIQTDASINPGNSGGALVDAEGRLVGINTAILSRSGGNQGVGFAVPIGLARHVMDQLVTSGKVVRGYLGVQIQDVTPDLAKELGLAENSGAIVADVTENSAAADAGLKNRDVIVEVNGKAVHDSRNLKLMIGRTPPGEKVDVKVIRDGKEKAFKVTLKEMPGEQVASAGNRDLESSDEALKGVGVGDITPSVRQQFNLPSNIKGAVITDIDTSSVAYDAGLREGDVIQEINRKPITSAEDAVAATTNVKDKRTLVRLWSNGGSRYVVVDETGQK